jgi:hypothetical protein
MLMILIPGLILVGLMIWASTRIKRSAALAFEQEEIDTPEYSLVKPEGFLAPADPAEGTIFSAYTKEYGREGAETVRQATVELRRFDNANLEEVSERAKIDSDDLVEEQFGVINEAKCANIVVARAEDGVPVETYHKLIAARDAVFQLSITVLPEHKEDHSRKIEEVLASFTVK